MRWVNKSLQCAHASFAYSIFYSKAEAGKKHRYWSFLRILAGAGGHSKSFQYRWHGCPPIPREMATNSDVTLVSLWQIFNSVALEKQDIANVACDLTQPRFSRPFFLLQQPLWPASRPSRRRGCSTHRWEILFRRRTNLMYFIGSPMAIKNTNVAFISSKHIS